MIKSLPKKTPGLGHQGLARLFRFDHLAREQVTPAWPSSPLPLLAALIVDAGLQCFIPRGSWHLAACPAQCPGERRHQVTEVGLHHHPSPAEAVAEEARGKGSLAGDPGSHAPWLPGPLSQCRELVAVSWDRARLALPKGGGAVLGCGLIMGQWPGLALGRLTNLGAAAGGLPEAGA